MSGRHVGRSHAAVTRLLPSPPQKTKWNRGRGSLWSECSPGQSVFCGGAGPLNKIWSACCLVLNMTISERCSFQTLEFQRFLQARSACLVRHLVRQERVLQTRSASREFCRTRLQERVWQARPACLARHIN